MVFISGSGCGHPIDQALSLHSTVLSNWVNLSFFVHLLFTSGNRMVFLEHQCLMHCKAVSPYQAKSNLNLSTINPIFFGRTITFVGVIYSLALDSI